MSKILNRLSARETLARSLVINCDLQLSCQSHFYAKIHHESIHRFAPRAYWIRINGEKLLPFEHRNFLARFFRKVDRKYQTTRRRIQHLLNPNQCANLDRGLSQNLQDSISLGGPLTEVTQDILMSEGSFSLELLGQQGLGFLLNEYLSEGAQNHYSQQGHFMHIVSLITMERWKTMVSKAAFVGSSSLGE